MKASKIAKIGGVGLLGFCALSLAGDKYLSPQLAQWAGFVGGFLGSVLAGSRERLRKEKPESGHSAAPASEVELVSGRLDGR